MRNKSNSPQDSSVGIVPSMPWRVLNVRPLEGYRLIVRFVDGMEGEVDMSALIMGKRAGVFAALRDDALFKQVYVEYGAVTWPGELDLAPDAMYEEIKQHGKWILH